MKENESGVEMKQLESILNQSIIDNNIENEDYKKYNVKKGLRNEDQTGVLVGLTQIADVVGYEKIENKKIDCEGRLYYRGYEIRICELWHSCDKYRSGWRSQSICDG